MTQENSSLLEDLEQIRQRAEANRSDLDELQKTARAEDTGDLEALRQHAQMFIEGIEAIAERMKKNSESGGEQS